MHDVLVGIFAALQTRSIFQTQLIEITGNVAGLHKIGLIFLDFAYRAAGIVIVNKIVHKKTPPFAF